MTFFDQAFDYVMNNEGGFTNDPLDSGGATKYGITQHDLEQYLGHVVSLSDISKMSIDIAKAIYRLNYWNPLSCGSLSSLGMAVAIFDTGVLYGIVGSCYLAQKTAISMGCDIKADGFLRDQSVAALNSVNQEEFINSFHGRILDRIEAVVSSDPKNLKFKIGWINRANRLLTLANVTTVINP